MKNKIKYILAVSGIAVLLYSCYPGGPEYTSDYDLVITDYYDEYWSVNTPGTYFMPDSLGYILDRDPENNTEIDPELNDFVLDEIAANMESMGYERIDTIVEGNEPDVIVLAELIVVKNTGSVWYPWYPWYPGGWYPGWGGGGYYPWYPWSPGYVYSFTTGTIMIEMIDVANIDLENEIFPVVWFAGLDGLVRSSESSNASAVTKLIQQAFDQSPYLKAN